MQKSVLDHYLQFSTYTNPGLYQKLLRKLPNDVRDIGLLVRKQVIHRSTLAEGNTGTNANLRFGYMKKVPCWRQPEDDVLVTASAMLAELYRRDPRGFLMDRAVQDKIVVTCRYAAVLMASILKSKGLPARVRSGNAPYFDMGTLGKVSADHWINQYYDKKQTRWVTIDVDGRLSLNEQFDPYDIPPGKFDFPADAWLNIRAGNDDPQRFWNAKPERGLIVVLWSLFYDFHCLMNNEVPYVHTPALGEYERFAKLTTKELKGIDDLAHLMQNPDENFSDLKKIWETKKEYRLLTGGLL